MTATRVAASSSVRSGAAALFLLAYTASGLAGLVYEVTWTRLLTRHLGHTTAAGSAVVGAFLLGLAVGAAAMGRRALSLAPASALRWYAGLELAVGGVALVMPAVLGAAAPLLAWAYRDGTPGLHFPGVRVLVALTLVLVPATALGATFPLAVRWLASASPAPTRLSAGLYAANTLGAAAGALVAGFVLIPAVGVWRTTLAGVATGGVSATLALAAARLTPGDAIEPDAATGQAPAASAGSRRRATAGNGSAAPVASAGRLGLAAAVVALSGFAALLHELAWTRVLALTIGPTTYAFAAALAAVIAGSAVGAGIGSRLVERLRAPGAALALALSAAAIAAALTYAVAGRQVPLYVATELAATGGAASWIVRGSWITAALVVPTAVCLGLAFPLALAVAGASRETASARFGLVYAANTAGSVAGSLAAGFLTIPLLGLQATLQIACGGLLVAAALVVVGGGLTDRTRTAVGTAAVAALTVVVTAPPWDRALMASGAYLYAPFVPEGLPLEPMLKAGTLRYYADGAAATVSVKTLTGTTTLTVDGKTDASNRGDMLTQALVAHVPLLLHPAPRDVAVIGLGSGVTVGAALTHPIERVDVVELSPEVVEASRFFEAENRRALDDPRTRLLVGDGRSHLRLARRRYDVIVSEPSNPWIAGVAALFTREYFAEAKARLTPGGVFCQWANAYNIGEADLRAIAATFRAEFPDGAAVLVGEYDVLFVGVAPGGPGGSGVPWEAIARHWARAGAAADLARHGARTPFAVLSLVVAGPEQLATLAAGAAVLDDDRMPLEFSAPREIHRRTGGQNGALLRALLGGRGGPAAVRAALDRATAADWRDRGRMLAGVDAHQRAFDDFVRALDLAPDDAGALDGLVRSAVLVRRADDALAALSGASAAVPSVARLVARSKLQAAAGRAGDAEADARAAAALDPAAPAAAEQLAALAADRGDAAALDAALATLETRFADRAATAYYRGVRAFLAGDAVAALRHAERALARDAAYAPACDLAGAAATRLDAPADVRRWFERSLTFDAHDSTAYANLGLLAFQAGALDEAASRFAEALWLDPHSAAAREGLTRVLAVSR